MNPSLVRRPSATGWKQHITKFLFTLAVATSMALPTLSQAASPALGSYNVDPNNITISGLSGGAFFTQQLAIAHSALIKGSASVAGGPYNCYNHWDTMTGCMYNSFTPGNESVLLTDITNFSNSGAIDNKSNMANNKAMSVIGTSDSIIGTKVQDATEAVYNGVGVTSGNRNYVRRSGLYHHWSTDLPTGPGISSCNTPDLQGEAMVSCTYDTGKELLQFFYGTLSARNTSPNWTSNLKMFNQGEFHSNAGLAQDGFIYVPSNCSTGTTCKLQVHFHSCTRSYDRVGDIYMKATSLAQWADTNNIIVLFPQVKNTGDYPMGNNSCFDFMKFYGSNIATKTAPQIAAMKAMIDRVKSGYASPPPEGDVIPSVPTGLTVTGTTSNSIALSWAASTGATSYKVYRNGGGTAVGTASGTSFTDSGLNASTSYSYQVSALNSHGESNKSSSVNGTTLAPPVTYTATASDHVAAGRAHWYPCTPTGQACANGSEQAIGTSAVVTTLIQTGPNYYMKME